MEPEVTIEEYERVVRDGILNEITILRIKQGHALEGITESSKNIGKMDLKFPNTGITINNKLNELALEFKKYGISLYAIDRGDEDGVYTPFIGEAIIQDLIGQYIKSSEKLFSYLEKVNEIFYNKFNQLQIYSQESAIKKLFRKIKSFFVSVEPMDISLTSAENEELDKCFGEYKEIDDSIYRYNLKDNLVDSIVKVIIDCRYEQSDIPEIIEEEIFPDLEKMQLLDLVPKLKEKLIEENVEKSFHDSIKVENYDAVQKNILEKHRQDESNGKSIDVQR